MKTLLPLERVSSLGKVQRFAAMVAAASISCLPLSSALADHSNGGGGGHGGGGGGHPSGGGSHGGFSHPAASYHGGGYRPGYSGSARNFSNTYHANLYSRNTSFSHVTNHQETAVSHHQSMVNQQHETGVNRTADSSHTLRQGNKADPVHTPNAAEANRTLKFDHSITTASAHTMMNQRLNQIANRQWTGHGHFCSDHFDRDHGCWFNHGGFWWSCNFWGANWYCNNLIALGFAPGLCWGWYDDICWGNIVVGMPLDLVDYYYPDPVYSDYGYYDGDEATIYYYATDDGRYKQVTVIDGNVVDVEIVDQIS
jgi:hypothetical protein